MITRPTLAPKADGKPKGIGCLLLVALPFAAIGVGAAGWLLWTLLAWAELHTWDEVPAEILRAELVTERGSDGDTYRVEARYRYAYGGREYEGTRVSLYSSADNVGNYHQDRHAELARHQRSRQPFRCYVDPDAPEKSILYRDLRLGMLGLQALFALVFGGAGLGIVVVARRGGRIAAERAALAQRYPDEPWRWRRDWRDGRIRGDSRTKMWMALGFAAFWNLVSAPLLFIIPQEVIEKGNMLALIGLLFPIVGAGLIVWAARAAIRWRRFGHSAFVMDAVPGTLGGELRGRIQSDGNVQPEDGFRLVLNCIRQVTTGHGKNRSTREDTLWQDEQRVPRHAVARTGRHWEIPVRFGVPYEQPPSDVEPSDDQIRWRLEAHAAVPGVDYAVGFEVPVFKTAHSDPEYRRPTPAMPAEEAAAELERDLAACGAALQRAPGGTVRYLFPAARYKVVAAGMTVFCAVFGGIAVALYRWGDVPLLFAAVFGLFALLLLWATVDAWLASVRVEVSRGEITIQGGILGMGRPRRLRREQISEIRPKRGMQAGSRVYYNLEIQTAGGGKVGAAVRVPSLRLAERLGESIGEALGR